MLAGLLSESGIKHGSVIDAVVVVTEVVNDSPFLFMIKCVSFDECVSLRGCFIGFSSVEPRVGIVLDRPIGLFLVITSHGTCTTDKGAG